MLVIPLSAFALASTLHWIALRLFPRVGLLDFPRRYGLTRAPIPYPTGILSVAVFVGFFAYLMEPQPQTWGVLGSVILLATVSFLDDRYRLHPLLRLVIHALIGLVLFLCAVRIYSFTNPFAGTIGGDVIPLDRTVVHMQGLGGLPIASGIFTILWIILTINALNWFDGIPGQVSVLSVIAFLVIGFLAQSPRVDQQDLALIAFILAGIAAAGAIFDFPPARVLMGDTGAMFFGLLIGVLTIYAGGKVATAFLVLGVPLIDFLFVIVRRLLRGQSPLSGNVRDQHLHHRLLAKGWSARHVILLTAALGTGFGVTALFLHTTGKFAAAGILFLVMLGLSWYSRPV